MLLANSMPDATIAWNVILTLLVLGNIVAVWWGIVRSNGSQKREVTFAAEFATKGMFLDLQREVERLDITVEGIRREIKEDRLALNAAAEARAEKIHVRINEVLERVSEVRGTVAELRR